MPQEEKNWTSFCEPGWSNVGLFHFPPTDPTKCYINIKAVNAIYAIGTAASILPLIIGAIAMKRLIVRGNRSPTLWLCIVFATLYCVNNLVMLSARLYLTHEEEIYGRESMRLYTVNYVIGNVFFWTASLVFVLKYIEYLKESCKMNSENQSMKMMALSYSFAAAGAISLTCCWLLLGVSSEEEVGTRSMYTEISLDVTIVICTYVVWPSASRTLANDLKKLVKGKNSHQSEYARKRAKSSLFKWKLMTLMTFSSGSQSVLTLVLLFTLPDFARILPYLITIRLHLVCPHLLTIGISILLPRDLTHRARVSQHPPSALSSRRSVLKRNNPPRIEITSTHHLFSEVDSAADKSKC